jgi:hypothetical protein
MGLYDFFKKKDEVEKGKKEELTTELFVSLSKYYVYIAKYLEMQQRGNFAPISAYENNDGEIVGFLYYGDDNTDYSLSTKEVINRMEILFNQKASENDIQSYIILYHSQFSNDNNHNVAEDNIQLKGITLQYNLKKTLVGKIGQSYKSDNGEVTYFGFQEFRPEENNTIFQTQLQVNKDYFTDKQKIVSPQTENQIGLTIKKSNSLNVRNIWCGMFGFESHRKGASRQTLLEHHALCSSHGIVSDFANIKTARLNYTDIVLKAVSCEGLQVTFLPVIKTDYILEVVNKEICEWENSNDLEAIVTGNGRNEFGLTYLATDYAEKREIYLSQRYLKIKISGIAFVLDVSNLHEQEEEPKYSEDFTMYFPSKDLPNYACFDFIGQIEEFKTTTFLEFNKQEGYIMKIRLITKPNFLDFFTIDMYVTQENMRFKELQKGMKVSGMFQMQGQIAK